MIGNNKQLTTNNLQQKQKKVSRSISGCKLSIVNCKLRKGQAMLVAILVIFTAAMALGVAAATVAMTQTNVIQNMKLSKQAYNLAETGVENTLMNMTRGDFIAPPPLSDGAGNCTITLVPSGSPDSYQILSVGEIVSPLGGGKKATKKIQVGVTMNDGVVNITSWQEVY